MCISLCCHLPWLEVLLWSWFMGRSWPKKGVHKRYQSICCILLPPPHCQVDQSFLLHSLPSLVNSPPSSLISFLHSSFHWSRPDKGRFCKGEFFQGRKVEFQKSLFSARPNWNRELKILIFFKADLFFFQAYISWTGVFLKITYSRSNFWLKFCIHPFCAFD